MLTSDLEATLLFRCLSEKKWRALSAPDFARKYEEEVGDLNDVTVVHAVDLPSFGVCTVYELQDGLVALEEANGKWSLYENERRARDRDHFKLWAEFARGRWHEKCPTEPGMYFVKDRDLGKRSVRELKVVQGRLKDISGGMVRPGLISEWQGLWFLPVIPPLPGSF